MKVSETNNLLVCYPDVAKSIDFKATIKAREKEPKKYINVTCLEDCSKITPVSGKRAIFKCLKNPKHDSWDAVIYSRTKKGYSCPQCASRVASKENNLLICYPEVAKSIDFNATIKAWEQNPKKYVHAACLKDCSKIAPKTNKRAIFKCLKNPEHDNWDTRISKRTLLRHGCPQCSLIQWHKSYIKTKLKNNNNLLDRYLEVAKSIDFGATLKAWNKDPKKYAHITCLEDCNKLTPSTHKRAIFKCLKNPEHNNWDTKIYNMTRRSGNCPQCAGRIASKENNLLVCYPDVAKLLILTRQ